MAYNDEFLKWLLERADDFIDHCLNHTFDYTKESDKNGNEVNKKEDPYIATVEYFITIWLPRKYKEKIPDRSTYYDWLKREGTNKSNTIKKIEDLFDRYNSHVNANYGKGEFWLMNKKGWSRNANNTNETSLNVKSIELDQMSEDELRQIASSEGRTGKKDTGA